MNRFIPAKPVAVLLAIGLLFTGFAMPSWGQDLEDELKDIKGQAKELEDELLAASKVVQRATAELRKIEAQIPAAQRALQTAQGNLKPHLGVRLLLKRR